ncbi:putative reverse transcriptase domain-containing protein [Tanacetum coccineum]
MVNVIPLDHVDDVPVVEPNQHDDVPVVPEPVLVDEDEDPKEDEFKEEEDPQEKEDDMEVNIEEDENELELTYPYEEVDPLNPSPPAFESEPEDLIEVENPIEHEDETVPASVHEVGESSTAPFLCEDSDGLLLGLMRRDINSLFGRMASLLRRMCGRETTHALVEKKGKAKDEYYGKMILDLGNEVRSSVEQGTAAMEKLVEKPGNAEDKAECKRLKKELEEARGFVFEERLNEAINVLIEDEKSPSSEPRGSPHDAYYCRMIKEVRCAIVAERAFGISYAFIEAKGYVAATLQGPALTWWNVKIATMGLETVKQMPWIEMKQLMTVEFCPIEEVQRMEHELWNLRSRSITLWLILRGANALPIPTCYDCGEQGHTRSRCPRKVKQEEVGEVCGRAEGSEYGYCSMFDIDPVKIGASYEVELADGRVVSMNTVLKGCTLNLVNHVFEIDLMPIELGTFDVIIGMDWLVKHDAVIVCGEKVARKYVERGCHLFLAHVMENKSNEKRIEDVPVIRNFPEVFPEELPGLPPPRQVTVISDDNSPAVFMDFMNAEYGKPYLICSSYTVLSNDKFCFIPRMKKSMGSI